MLLQNLLLLSLCLTNTPSNAVWNPKSEFRLFGGVRVEPGELPFTVLIALTRQYGLEPVAFGGSILSDRWILTAAHSVYGHTYRPGGFEVIAGQYDLLLWEPSRQSRFVRKVIAHPDYRNQVIGLHDVALLLLMDPLEFTEFVQPVAVDLSDVYPSGVATVVGYGTILLNGKDASFLTKLSVNVLTVETCASRHPSWNPSVMCTDPGSCDGDSGTALVEWRSDRWVQVGLVSFGQQCVFYGTPTYHTRMSKYVRWINQTLLATEINSSDGAGRNGAWRHLVGASILIICYQCLLLSIKV